MAKRKTAAEIEASASLVTAFMGFRNILRKFVGRIVKPHDIDDILQETFIRAYAASEKTEIRHPRSFMLRTARNLALNHATSAYSKRTQMEDISSSEVYQTSETFESEFESKERFLGFCRAVRTLPLQCRRVFVLKKVYGLSQQEIAKYLDISESTVEKHVAKGLSLCREAMLAMGYAAGADANANEPRRAASVANVVQFPDRTRIHEDASAWLAKVDKGLSPQQQADLQGWLAADPLHRTAFMEMAALWDELDTLADLAGLFPLDQTTARKPQRRRAGGWALAAAASVGVAAVSWWLLGQDGGVSPSIAAPATQLLAQDFATEVGAHATKDLPDGSVVTLNTATQVRVQYSTASRDVFLQRGEAHFKVAHDAAHPFNVHVGKQILQAVGTAFNVQLRSDGEIEVMVTEGRVKVTRLPAAAQQRRQNPSGSVDVRDTTLVEGEVALLGEAPDAAAAALQVVHLEPVAMDIKLAWQRGMLVFQGEPLETMLAEVGRYTTTQFVLADRELAAVRVAGYFRAGDIEGLLEALRENFRIDSQPIDGNRIVLRAAR